ncbi:MAG: ATP-binding protein [Clostridia bacterium]|nr:ATP-binding protein [Clostridia bacterium]
MLKRKIEKELKEWKETKKNECLLVKGARQVGKTFIIKKFGEENYKSFIYINFVENEDYKKIFEGSLTASEIYKKISIYLSNVELIKGDTLIFLDEIQECPNARTALKFLALDNSYDIIASGSLLGINYKSITSIPVGYERQIEMHSLDFEEFLWAVGKNETAISLLKEYYTKKEKVEHYINNEFLELLKSYMVIGGMPDVVNSFLESNNYQTANKTQLKLLDSYLSDIEKYATIPEKQKIKDCYYSIPRQLAKENKKFQYKIVTSDGTSKKYANSLNWLVDASMIKLCTNVSTPQFPLTAYEKIEQYKVYASDIGLLTCMYGFETQQAILKDTLVGPAKGGIYENLIFDILTKRGYKLHYYKTENSEQEIEFLIAEDARIIPIEVKAKNGTTLSLNNFIKEFKPPFAYKLISGNIGVIENKITLPLYMAMFI